MGKIYVQFQVDEIEWVEAIQILEQLGLNLPSYLRMCVARLVKEKDIPFSMKMEASGNKGINALKYASQIAEENGISDMTLEEINAEITNTRNNNELVF